MHFILWVTRIYFRNIQKICINQTKHKTQVKKLTQNQIRDYTKKNHSANVMINKIHIYDAFPESIKKAHPFMIRAYVIIIH